MTGPDCSGHPRPPHLCGHWCTVGVLAGTHRCALLCPGRMAWGTERQPSAAADCASSEVECADFRVRRSLHVLSQSHPSVEYTCGGFRPTWVAPCRIVHLQFVLVHTLSHLITHTEPFTNNSDSRSSCAMARGTELCELLKSISHVSVCST